MKKLKKVMVSVCENTVLQLIMVAIFFMPLIATLGQYISSSFIFEKSSIHLLFWPGYDKSLSIKIHVWLSFGVMAFSYVCGIYYMCRRKTFIKVFFISFISLFLAQILGNIINSFVGIKELQNIHSMNFNGLINKMILAQWHNPVWEEIFFTGIPLILYVKLIKNKSEKVKTIGKWIYFIVPSIICSIYHIPNHGAARIVDAFFIHIMFEYIAFKFSFFANLVMHYIFDAIIVVSIYKLDNVSYEEIEWLYDNSSMINTTMSILVLLFLIILICLFVRGLIKQKNNNIKGITEEYYIS